MMKKLMSMLLVLAMVLTLAPTVLASEEAVIDGTGEIEEAGPAEEPAEEAAEEAAEEPVLDGDTEIKTVEIHGFVLPAVGKTPVGAADLVVPMGAPYRIRAVTWKDADVNASNQAVTSIQAGHSYYAVIAVEPREGYYFTDNNFTGLSQFDSVTINGGTDLINYPNSWVDAVSQYNGVLRLRTATIGIDDPSSPAILSVDLTVATPAAGRSPAWVVKSASDRYAVDPSYNEWYRSFTNGISWYDKTNDQYLSSEDEIPLGAVCVLSVRLKASDGLTFSRDIEKSVSINGIRAKVSFYTDKTILEARVVFPPAEKHIPLDAKHFPDEEFRWYLSQNVDKDGSDTLSPDEIAAAQRLDINGIDLWSIEGVRYFSALEELYCFDNDLAEIGVGDNNLLRVLDCSENGANVLYVGNCTDLEELYCSGNELDEVELVDNANLVKFDFSDNLFRRADVSNCPKLRLLRCNGNQLTELDISNNPYLIAAVKAGPHTTSFGSVVYYTEATADGPVATYVTVDGKSVKASAALITDPGVKIITGAGAKPTLTIASDGKTAQVTGDFSGLYARVALVLNNNGQSGLYVTQATINADGSILIPAFMVPGLTVRGVNVALVPSLADIQSSTPKVEATASKMLT